MGNEVSVWRIDHDGAKPVSLSGMDLEKRLQDVLASNISILADQLMVIGREVQVGTSGRVDLLAIDPEGCLVIIELKRGRTPRDVVAQVLDYGSWISTWEAEEIQETFIDYQKSYLQSESPQLIDDAFQEKFGLRLEGLNESYRLVVVANEIDSATERISDHLQNQYSVPISVETFQAFRISRHNYLIRSHRADSDPFDSNTTSPASSHGEWNGEFYANWRL